MKIATIVALLHPFVILVGTALSSYLYAHHPEFVTSEGGWLNNPSFHGLSEQLYEYTSSAANNGSGFEGLGVILIFGILMRYSTYSESFYSDCRSGGHRRVTGSKEIHSGECRYFENGYGNFWCYDFCCYFHCGCFVILPGTRIEHDCRTF